jgi:DNA-binding IclR family transcriptional regulator
MDVRKLAIPILTDLAASTQETAILTMLNGESSVLIEKVDSPLSVRMAAEVGVRGTLHAGGSNVPLLAFAPAHVREKFLSGDVTLDRHTANTASTPQRLAELVATVRERGYHVSRGEAEQDIMAVGAPVFDRKREAKFCVSVAGPAQRMEAREESIIQEVVEAAKRLGSLLAV